MTSVFESTNSRYELAADDDGSVLVTRTPLADDPQVRNGYLPKPLADGWYARKVSAAPYRTAGRDAAFVLFDLGRSVVSTTTFDRTVLESPVVSTDEPFEMLLVRANR